MARGAKHTMSRKRRSATVAAVAAAAVPLIALPLSGLSPTAAAEFSYFPTEPTRVLTLSLLPGGNDDDLSGVMCASPRTCQDVVYSRASQPEAVAILDASVRDGTTGKKIIFAYSQGGRVAAQWIRDNEGTEGAPTAEDLSFVMMGNPGRKYGGSDRSWENTFPETSYKVIDVSQEYDLASDFPDDRRNVLAMMNANWAFFITHQNYETVDIYSPDNYVWTEGNTTYVFVPTENLPLLEPLRWFGLGALADALNEPLKEIVDRAYDRSYLPAQPGLPPVAEPEPVETLGNSDSLSTAQVQLTSARTESAGESKARTATSPDEVPEVAEDIYGDEDGDADGDGASPDGSEAD
ncbi:PE-PPE domain-containing protein, partial [Mycobacterium sp. ITM-2017-0098]